MYETYSIDMLDIEWEERFGFVAYFTNKPLLTAEPTCQHMLSPELNYLLQVSRQRPIHHPRQIRYRILVDMLVHIFLRPHLLLQLLDYRFLTRVQISPQEV